MYSFATASFLPLCVSLLDAIAVAMARTTKSDGLITRFGAK